MYDRGMTRQIMKRDPVADAQGHLSAFLSECGIFSSAMPPCFEIPAQDSFLSHEREPIILKFAEVCPRPASEFMQKESDAVRAAENVITTADIILRRGIKRLPVHDAQSLVGIIDRSDLCAYLMKERNIS